MSGIDGIRLLRTRYPGVLLLILTVYDDDEMIFDALCAGACGYLLKKTPAARLMESLREAVDGGAPMSPDIARRVVDLFRTIWPPDRADYDLTPHETRLLKLLVEGHNYKTAAAEDIHWDNPFVWDGGTNPIDFSVGTSDVNPPCNSDIGVWHFPGSGVSPSGCRRELFGAGASGGGLQGVTWWDAVMNWPILLAFTIVGDADINLEFTIGLRQAGSVDQTILSFFNGSQGLRSLTRVAKQPSLRKLFRPRRSVGVSCLSDTN